MTTKEAAEKTNNSIRQVQNHRKKRTHKLFYNCTNASYQVHIK